MAFPNLSAFATAIIATVILWLGVGSSTGAPPQVASFSVQETALEQVNDPELVAEALLLIEEAYRLAGMSHAECEEVLQQYATSYGLYTGEAESGKPFLVIPRNHPELIVNDALKYAEMGSSERIDILLQMGIRRNESAVASAMGAQLDDDPPALQCEVYEITLIWCDLDQQGQPIRKKTTNYISKTCWDDVLACPTTLECTGDDIPWYTIFHIGQCEDLGVPAQRCVYISWDPNPTWVDCDEVGASCACFYETAPIYCGLIEKTCAHPVNGPDGCPGTC